MAVATGTALLIGGAIATGAKVGTDLYSAKKQGEAVRTAAQQQTDAIREARAYAEPLYTQARDQMGQIYQQSQAGLAPYAAQGTQGLYALSDFLGVPRAPAGAAPMAAPAAPVAPTLSPHDAASHQRRPANAPTIGYAVPRGTVPTPATQSSYVTLQAPTGETQQVPAEHANYYLSRGATRI